MSDLFRPYLRQFDLVFFYGIIIYHHCLIDYVCHLWLVLDLLASNQFVTKLFKCVFDVFNVDYLGHIISTNGVISDHAKIQVVLN